MMKNDSLFLKIYLAMKDTAAAATNYALFEGAQLDKMAAVLSTRFAAVITDTNACFLNAIVSLSGRLTVYSNAITRCQSQVNA